MPRLASKTEQEQKKASSEAFRGATIGAATYGLATAFLGVSGYFLSPIYRSLTIQFKVFLQISGMTLGGWIEADRRLRAYEFRAQRERRVKREEEVWREWERMVKEEEREKLLKAGESGGKENS